MGGSLAAESLFEPETVLEAVPDGNGADAAVPATACGVAAAKGGPAGGISSTPGDGRASLLAAQASETINASEMNIGK